MNNHKKLINILIGLLALSTVFSVYALLGKHNASSPVFLFMHNKTVRYASEDSLSHPKFWDNYPYYVMISTGQNIHLTRYVEVDTTSEKYARLKNYIKQPGNLFYRFHYVQGNDTVYRQTFNLIMQSKKDTGMVVLTDNESVKYLSAYLDTAGHERQIFILKDHLPIYMEKPNLSYFFKISEDDKVEDIFVPRMEIPEVTERYLKVQEFKGT